MSANNYHGPAANKATDSTASKPPDSVMSPVEIHNLLSTQRRLYTVEYLLEQNTVVDYDSLVDYVTARETQTNIDEIDPDQRNSVRISLHQTHLPKLDDLGVVEYDHRGRGKTVSLGARSELVEPYIHVDQTVLDRVRNSVSAAVGL